MDVFDLADRNALLTGAAQGPGEGTSRALTEIEPKGVRTKVDVDTFGTALGLKCGLRAARPNGAAGKGGSINIVPLAPESSGTAYPSNCILTGLLPTAMDSGLATDVAEVGLFSNPAEAVGRIAEMALAGRLGEVSDLAGVVVLLASDASHFVTGAGMPVDGGTGM